MTHGQFTVRNHSGVRVRGGRGLRDEFSAFHASAYPQLVAQTAGDHRRRRVSPGPPPRRRWRGCGARGRPCGRRPTCWCAPAGPRFIAAERESTAPSDGRRRPRRRRDRPGRRSTTAEPTPRTPSSWRRCSGCRRVQRRALVLHYMGGVSVVDMAALSGSSAEHIELLLDDGFTALAESLVWADEPAADPDADGADPRRRSGRRHRGPRRHRSHQPHRSRRRRRRIRRRTAPTPTPRPRRRPGRRSRPALRLDRRGHWPTRPPALPPSVTAPLPGRDAAPSRGSCGGRRGPSPSRRSPRCVRRHGWWPHGGLASPDCASRPAIYADNGSGAGVARRARRRRRSPIRGHRDRRPPPWRLRPRGAAAVRRADRTARPRARARSPGSSGPGVRPGQRVLGVSAPLRRAPLRRDHAAAATGASGGGSSRRRRRAGPQRAAAPRRRARTTPPTTPASRLGGTVRAAGTGPARRRGTRRSRSADPRPRPSRDRPTADRRPPPPATATAPTTTTPEPTPVEPDADHRRPALTRRPPRRHR